MFLIHFLACVTSFIVTLKIEEEETFTMHINENVWNKRRKTLNKKWKKKKSLFNFLTFRCVFFYQEHLQLKEENFAAKKFFLSFYFVMVHNFPNHPNGKVKELKMLITQYLQTALKIEKIEKDAAEMLEKVHKGI